jgi:ketosteroid isomerase-like protein
MIGGVTEVTPRELAEEYLSALGRADLDALLALFTAGAVVHSPLYGLMPARDFYAALLADTAGSQLTLRGVMDGAAIDGTPLVSVWFTFGWRLAGGTQVSFDVVDVLEVAGDGRIAALRIICDTSGARPAFEAQTGRRSGHSGLPADA